MKTLTPIIFLVMLIAFTQCGSNSKKEQDVSKDSLVFAQPDESDMDTTILLSEDSSKAIILGKGPVRKLWERSYKWCGFKTQLTGSRPVYLGPANTLRMGSVIDNKGNTFNALDDLLTADQKKSIFKYGAATPCDFEDDSKKKIETVLKASLDFGDAELNSLVQTERRVIFKIDSFKVNSLFLDRLSSLLAKTDNPSLKEYLQSCSKDKRLLLSHEVEVVGFNATIKLDNKIKAGLEGKIKQGAIAKLADANGQATVEIIDSRTIKIASKNAMFIPFAACVKGEIVKTNNEQ